MNKDILGSALIVLCIIGIAVFGAWGFAKVQRLLEGTVSGTVIDAYSGDNVTYYVVQQDNGETITLRNKKTPVLSRKTEAMTDEIEHTVEVGFWYKFVVFKKHSAYPNIIEIVSTE
jgi:hypothetical protein